MRTHPARSRSLRRGRHGLNGLLPVVFLLPIALVFLALPPSACSNEKTQAEVPARKERPLPRFSGERLGGGHAGTEHLQGRRGVIYVFATSDKDAEPVAQIVHRLRDDASNSNVGFLGVNRDLNPARVVPFAKQHDLEFPILVDRDLSVSRKLQIPPGKATVIVVDAAGYIIGGFAGLEGDLPEIEKAYENEVRRTLHLEPVGGDVAPSLGVLPEAPEFEVKSLSGDKMSLSELENKVVVLVFFSPTCPHCHESLKFLNRLHERTGHADLQIVAVSVSNHIYVIEEMAESLGYELPIYTDPDREAQSAYKHRHTVPDIILIDRERRVLARMGGAEARTEARITMEVRQALGLENPILLDRAGYSGEELCQTCHRSQHQTWALTNHAYAFETLVEHGEDRNPECLSCHTVGWEKPGGYSLQDPHPHLQGVQCENCHGRGGPHQEPDFLAQGYAPVCESCHNEKHSLNFKFAERLPDVSHSVNLRFANLSLEERQALLSRRDRRERALFEEGAFVGSEACQSCHTSEHALWAKSAHAHAFDTLTSQNAQEKAECQKCHTTGFQEPGGYPEGGQPLVQVGCESCHGPGGNHIKEDAPKRGNILALTDKCDSCVILQICGSCHDDQNDPGFEFELMDKIDRIRHGSAGTKSAQR